MMKADLSQCFDAFRNDCVWMRNCYNTYTHLFASGEETAEALHASAAHFFSDLNRILIDYCYLQFCKLTDPPFSSGRGGQRPNLTVRQLDLQLDQSGLLTDEILDLSASIMGYRPWIEGARNRLVSHTDLEDRLGGRDIGAHPEEEMLKFLSAIQSYCDVVGIAIGSGPLDFRTQAGVGDVQDLTRILRKAAASRRRT